MNEFEKIIAAEKKEAYELEDKDQFTFETIAQIHTQKSRLLRRAFWVLLTIIISVAVSFQLYYLQSASYSGLIASVAELIKTHPYVIALANLGVIGLVLGLKRLQII